MPNPWSPSRGPFGMQLQSGIPTAPAPNNAGRAMGLSLRGVVVNVYAYDAEVPYTGGEGTSRPLNTIYVDVMLYGKHSGRIPRVLWTQERMGLHEGDLCLPRAATFDVTGDPIDWNQGTNWANVDGDHVIIQFLEDDLSQPFVARCIPHPSSDIGNDAKDIGHRMRFKTADKSPRFWKHRGVFFGIDDEGNFVIDLTEAHLGVYDADGKEPAPAEDGVSGNVNANLPKASKILIKIGDGDDSQIEISDKMEVKLMGGASLLLEDKDTGAKLTIGDGAKHVAIVEHLQTLYTQLNAYLTAGTVLTALGPSTPLPVLSGPVPPWDPAINSTKVSLPDG